MAYNSAYTGPQIDAAVGAVQNKESTWDGKQDKLTGQSGQVVGFDEEGNAVAQTPPETGDVKADGSVPMTGDLNMGGHKITNLGAPTNANDAVRQADLKVVSDEVDGIISGTTGITLAPATTTKIGGVIVGDGIEVEADGTISTNPVPTGGTPGQLLTKTETGEEWADAPSGLPEGGTEGQMLYRGANGAEWGDKPVMYVNITESGGTYSADKTAQEIYEAYQNGYAVFAVPWDSDIPILLLSYTYKGNTAKEYVASFLASSFAEFYQVIIQDITNFVMFASATLSANDISFTPTSTLTSENVQDAIEEVDTQLSTKLTTPTGTQGQLLGFTADNTVGAVDAPEGLSSYQAITLSSSGWSSNTQTVTVSGVSATETAQLITPTPAIASQSAYYEAGIMCTNQGANSLTFTCQTVPTSNLTVYVVIQPLG